MNQLAVISPDLGDFQDNFFEPVNSNELENLLIRHGETKRRMSAIHAELDEPYSLTALSFFVSGNTDDRTHIPSMERLFDMEGALKSLHAHYWQKAFELTDVYEHMPAKRREEWSELIRSKQTPEFEENAVKSTLFDLLNSRSKFFAERVDGIFRSLSGEHVTNSPEGFNKRMIFNGVMDQKWETTNHQKVWVLDDFREVVARLLCREKSGWHSDKLVHAMYRNTGVWHDIDGGAFRAKIFKKGTIHLELHPDISWKLNQVLSFLYPNAIPESFRRKPKKANKTFDVIEDVLPVGVINILADHYVRENGYVMQVNRLYSKDKVIREMVESVLVSIGGIRTNGGEFKFDYPFREVVDLITMTGRIPNQKSFQYYPTPRNIAEAAIEIADIQDHHRCLEPSAGQGGLADYMPKENTHCVELSELNAEVLRSKGFAVDQADFLEWGDKTSLRFSRICLNPPYSQSRYKLHLEKAVSLLENDGVLVAILPASTHGQELISGYSHEYSEIYENEFKGTSISTVIVKITKGNNDQMNLI